MKGRRSVWDIARDLIKLYAKRRREKRLPFFSRTRLCSIIGGFISFMKTRRPVEATKELRQDMESARPMGSSCLHGDVSSGKTEVAIRAAFKAAVDNKRGGCIGTYNRVSLQRANFKEAIRRMACQCVSLPLTCSRC